LKIDDGWFVGSTALSTQTGYIASRK